MTTPPRRSASGPGPATSSSRSAPPAPSSRSADTPAADPSGAVAGFADATGRFLPLVATLNAARVLDAAATPARRRPRRAVPSWPCPPRPGADGLVHGALLRGRAHPEPSTRHRRRCTGCAWRNSTPAHLARAAVEGLLCALADGLDALVATGASRATGPPDRRRRPVGGGAADRPAGSSAAPVVVPPAGEYVADGAARQAAWVALGGQHAPQWTLDGTEVYQADPTPVVREQYGQARELVLDRPR